VCTSRLPLLAVILLDAITKTPPVPSVKTRSACEPLTVHSHGLPGLFMNILICMSWDVQQGQDGVSSTACLN
jgi:hypothetical protein